MRSDRRTCNKFPGSLKGLLRRRGHVFGDNPARAKLLNLKGEGDTTAKHLDDTIYGGDFLANQPLVKRMSDEAPAIIDLLDRMGVPFNRTAEGLLDCRRFGGTLFHRTAFAGAPTGQQLLYALDEQVRRHEKRWRGEKVRRIHLFIRGAG